MQIVNRLTMLHVAVSNMPKAKEFYADKLGLKIESEYRQSDDHWWVALALPEGGVSVTLTTHHAQVKPGSAQLYFATSDVAASHKELSGKGAKVGELGDDLHGPGSGVKYFQISDPDGNLIHIEQV
jgi:predicted enzyme related to lactoylglutathione lyase